MRRGAIRFVGGPLHNRHLAVEWQPRLEWWQPRLEWWQCEAPAADAQPDTRWPRIERVCYELRHMFSVVRLGGRVPRQLTFFEYHCLSDLRPASGDGFFQPLPASMFSDFCWRLMTVWSAARQAHLGLPAPKLF